MGGAMISGRQGWLVAVTLALAGCASAPTRPKVIQAPVAVSGAPVLISDVTLDAADGVWINDKDRKLLLEKISYLLNAQGSLADPDSPAPAYAMRVRITRFERGNAAARMAFIGLGQIHIEGSVSLIDAAGKSYAQYQLAKGFVLGGVAGGMTSAGDVESGFAKSVVAVVAPKP